MPSSPTPTGAPFVALRHRVPLAGRAPLLALTLALAAATAAGSAGAQAIVAPGAESTFASATLAYELNHWEQAFALLAQLADEGHPEARRMALQMLRHGPRLYGKAFEVAPGRRQAWLEKPDPPLARGAGTKP